MDYNQYRKNRQAMLAGAKIPLQEMRLTLQNRLNMNRFKHQQEMRHQQIRAAQIESAVELFSQGSQEFSELDEAILVSASRLNQAAEMFPDSPVLIHLEEMQSSMRIPLSKLVLLAQGLLDSKDSTHSQPKPSPFGIPIRPVSSLN